MKILVLNVYTLNSPHFETDLEILQRHLDKGHEVTATRCNSALLACDSNPNGKMSTCYRCSLRHLAGMKALTGKVRLIPLFTEEAFKIEKDDPICCDFQSIDELKNYTISNFDVGDAVLSSVISATRDPYPDLRDPKITRMIHALLVSSCRAYYGALQILRTDQFDRAYLYNGRYSILRALVRACERMHFDFYCHERGASLETFMIFDRNIRPHDREPFVKSVNELWEKSDPSVREKIAAEFYEERRMGIPQAWHSFIRKQKQGTLPKDFDEKKRNVVIFSTSDDEDVAAGVDWATGIYKDFQSGVEKIVNEFKSESDFVIYVREHPNLSGVNTKTRDKLLSLKAKNLVLIPAENKVSSYCLMSAAEKVITFGSTIGIEANFWGVPSISCKNSIYSPLGGIYEPQSHEEVIQLIHDPLAALDSTPALKFGFYKKSFGEEFRYFKPTGILSGKFKGSPMQPSFVDLIMSKLCKFIRRGRLAHLIFKKRFNIDIMLE